MKSFIYGISFNLSYNYFSACQFASKSFSGYTTVRLVVKLSGGKGDVAWQHAQLFRQGADNVNEYPFEVIINLRKK